MYFALPSRMSSSLTLIRKDTIEGKIHYLPASKSLSNRALIIHALAGGQTPIHNLSEANDTVVMQRLLAAKGDILNAEDAGTVMRFITAYSAVTSTDTVIITGSDRMKQRPIGILVDSLKQIGASITYTEKEGFPPLSIRGPFTQKSAEVNARGDVSSQFISALMMIAPILPKGLTLKLEGKVGSLPYIQMTASLMKKFGVEVTIESNSIGITHQLYKPTEYTVEADWSAASYWFAFVALAKQATIILPSIALRSLQGDRIIVDMMEQLGVIAEPNANDLLLRKKESRAEFSWDFTHCPDLAQTIAVVCAAKGILATFTGLESLRIKETDRILALQQELKKIGATLTEADSQWILIPSKHLPESVSFSTYKDHRMAMAFAPLSCLMDVTFDDHSVVKKSYPKFWEDVLEVRR
ncbi:MAG: 3-phosphoshikimate 1-carboxyvinyltransferase [Flammeovirgaceae bacterium]|nr:3-phosphoshikimate 1-carboxyvinyltransferase [Flammeovirgaceae bacterium]